MTYHKRGGWWSQAWTVGTGHGKTIVGEKSGSLEDLGQRNRW